MNDSDNDRLPPPPDNNPPANPPVVIPEAHRLESLDDWLRLNGLPAPTDVQEERWERIQDRQRVQQARAYQQKIHDKVFVDDTQAQQKAIKQEQLQAMQNKHLTIICANHVSLEKLDLVPLAAACDFVFALASSWRQFNPEEEEDVDDDTDKQMNNDDNSISTNDNVVELNLPDFSCENVQIFVDIVNQKQSLQDITSGSDIVEVCRLAHFLQNTDLLQETVQILLQSIDSANCLAMTQLADQLHLPRLFEASLKHMMQSVHNLEEGECWDSLTPELKERIGAIQSAIHSSIHDQRSALYFGSLQEYLAIFAERVHYYKERLAEAVEQQQDREQSPAWFDTQRKIERQRARLHTLQVAFQEQKKLFGRSLS